MYADIKHVFRNPDKNELDGRGTTQSTPFPCVLWGGMKRRFR